MQTTYVKRYNFFTPPCSCKGYSARVTLLLGCACCAQNGRLSKYTAGCAAFSERHAVTVVCCVSHQQTQQRAGPDISALDPTIQKQWDHEANSHLGDIVITRMSGKKVWWNCDQCPDGHPHKWPAVVYSRTHGCGCPYCSGQRLCQHNSLATKAPKVAAFWDNKRNGCSAHEVVATSNKMAHWRCPVCQHAWTARSTNRVRQGSGCPECFRHARTKNKRHPTFTQCQHPLLAEWDQESNSADGLFPDSISLHSKKNIHWTCNKCPAGQKHSWIVSPNSRLSGQHPGGCPYCASQRVCMCNSLQTHYPSIAAEWNYDMNDCTPNDYTYSSHREVWWQHPERGSWKQSIRSRTMSNVQRAARSRLASSRCKQ